MYAYVSFQKSVAEVLIFTTSFLLCMFQFRILLYALKLQYSKMGHKMCCYMGDTTKVNLALDSFYFFTPPHSTSQPSRCSYNSYMVQSLSLYSVSSFILKYLYHIHFVLVITICRFVQALNLSSEGSVFWTIVSVQVAVVIFCIIGEVFFIPSRSSYIDLSQSKSCHSLTFTYFYFHQKRAVGLSMVKGVHGWEGEVGSWVLRQLVPLGYLAYLKLFSIYASPSISSNKILPYLGMPYCKSCCAHLHSFNVFV